MTAAPMLSVVIPTYNGRRLLAPALASLARHRPASIEVEVIVADDASTDDTGDWLARTHPDVRHVRLATNGGFCLAANAGIAASRGPYVQLLNNDAEVTAGWAEAGLGPFSDPAVGSVAPLVLVRSDPSRVDSAGDQYAWIGWPSKRGHGQAASLWERHPSDPVLGASGSGAFYRGDALRALGGFDPAYGSYYEDVDLAFRLRWAGLRCVYAPACRILHDVSATYDHALPALQRRMSRNAELLFWSNLPTAWLLAAAVPHLAFTLAQACWRLGRGRLGPFAAGKLDAFRMRAELAGRRRLRRDLAHGAAARPHFPIRLAPLAEARDHLRRPREASSSVTDAADARDR